MSDEFAGGPGAIDRSIVLAYLRGELSKAEHAQFVVRLATEPSIRDELETLEAAAQIAQAQLTERGSEAAYERFVAARRLQAHKAQSDAPLLRPSIDERRSHLRQPPRIRPAQISLWPRIARWMRDHATVLQPAFITLAIVQAAVIAHMMPSHNDVSTIRGVQASCNDVWVTFKDGVSEAALRNWLTFYDASIVGGPDMSGRYRIETRSGEGRAALLHSEDSAKLVRHVEALQGCEIGKP